MIDGLFTLPKDILLEPIESLPDTVLTGFEHSPGDFALTRPRSRIHTHIVNDSTAKLLQIFREPVTIADAVIKFSRIEQADPAATLDEAFPVLRILIETGMLLPSDSHLASPIEFLIGRGEQVGDLVVDQPVAVVIDTEVYRARASDGRWAALKIARPGSEGRLKAALQHEAGILARLDGACSPRLIAQGDHAGRPFIAMEWCRGVDALAAAELVRSRDPVDTRELKAILLAIVEAYARLHEQRVVHGDVHPRNLLIGSSGRATIIDFGQAHSISERLASGQPGRGVVDLYMEPELARARLDGGAQPPTPAGEQYSIAALLYFLLLGAHTHDFVLEEKQMLRQVLGDPPRTFAERGLLSFGHVERALRRALEKCPEARFASVREFKEALQQALDRDGDAPPDLRRHGRDGNTARSLLLDELIERSILGGQLMIEGFEPPSASVNFGSAGLALAMLRIAQQREDGSLLAVADIWSHAALRDIESAGAAAFTAPDLEMSPELVGHASLYHSSLGVLCVAALVADAQADEARRKQAVERFVAAASADEARAELVFGLSGTLLGCGVLLDALGLTSGDEERVLTSLGNDLSGKILDRLGRLPIIGDAADSGSLGVAHGYAGIFYSLLQWAQLSKAAVPEDLQLRLEQLAGLAQPVGRGLAWPVSAHRRTVDGMRATWCNGAAGHLHLWLIAYELLDDPHYLKLAEGAAWTSYEAQSTGGDLCCGSAGRAYALLRFFRQTGDQIWLDRAYEQAEHAAKAIRKRQLRRNSLYRGEVGVCLLAADLNDPYQARMPLFELG